MDALSLIRQNGISVRQEADRLLQINERTREYGLSLTAEEALVLIREKNRIVRNSGRIELENVLLEKLAAAFASSGYISQRIYAETLEGLITIFYYVRGEFELGESDDDLIAWMRDSFEEECGGSLELLESRALEGKLRLDRGIDDLLYDDDFEAEAEDVQ